MTDPRTEGRSAAVLAAFAAIVVIAAVALVFMRSSPTTGGAADAAIDHAKAIAALTGKVAPGDAVFVLSKDPGAGADYRAAGIEAVAGEKVPAGAAAGRSRVWVVRAPLAGRAPGSGLAGDPLLARMTAGAPLDGGPGAPEIVPFTFAGGAALGYDFFTEVSHAAVQVVLPSGGAPLPCPLAKDRHQCPNYGHVWVGPREVTVAGASATCLWAHPYKGGTLEVRYSGVPAGKELRGRYAFTDRGAAAKLAPITFEVSAGSVVKAFTVPRAKGFKEFAIPLGGGVAADGAVAPPATPATSAPASGGPGATAAGATAASAAAAPGAGSAAASAAPASAAAGAPPAGAGGVIVTFRISTPESGAAHFCFDAYMTK